MIALDTTAIIDLFKEDSSLLKTIKNIDEEFMTTSINQQEIYFGLDANNTSHQEEEEHYNSFFNNLMVYPHESEGIKKASNIFWNLNKKGIQIGKFDCMIAGILMANNITTILTKNIKHFNKIDGLKVMGY